MQRRLKLIFIFGLLISALPGLAQAAANFNFTYNNKNYPVDAQQIEQWKSTQVLDNGKVLNPPATDFTSSILEFASRQALSSSGSKTYDYSLSLIYNYVKSLAQSIDAPVQEPELEIQNNIVTKFTPSQNGIGVDILKTSLDALTALQVGRNSMTITVNTTEPQKQLGDTNSLGIKQLIAHGVSKFNGSPNNRRHNIAVGITKFKGLIIPQGAKFSFDKYLGPVEAEEGFLPELVIKGAQGTIPELGGGLCQVSTTTFRAAMQAGLPITERRNHAYAVQYYSPQGTDATIYPGSADLVFINDTPGAILIWPYEQDNNTLVFDFYGTDDGRKVTLENPVVTDKKADGSMKASWAREVVSASGVARTDVFKSDYQPPALFHHTEEFVKAAVDPVKGLQMPKS